jgi:hypothetical protein
MSKLHKKSYYQSIPYKKFETPETATEDKLQPSIVALYPN